MIVSNVVFTVMLIATFFVLWSCIRFAIENSPLQQVNWALAPAATVLCILTMLRTTGDAPLGSIMDAVLVPWAALGVSILFVLLLLFLSRIGLLPRKPLDKWGRDTKRQSDYHATDECDVGQHTQEARIRKTDGKLARHTDDIQVSLSDSSK